MKVKAVAVEGAQNITVNRIYTVIEEKETAYVITNDIGRTGTYKKHRFEVVPEVRMVKVGQMYNHDGDDYIVASTKINGSSFAGLISIKTGESLVPFVSVADINNINATEATYMALTSEFSLIE